MRRADPISERMRRLPPPLVDCPHCGSSNVVVSARSWALQLCRTCGEESRVPGRRRHLDMYYWRSVRRGVPR